MKNKWICLIKIILFLLLIGFLMFIISPFINKDSKKIDNKQVTEKAEKKFKLSKEDITNEKEIIGAKIIIKEEVTGNIIEKWTSSENTMYFNIAKGEYVFEETIEKVDEILIESTKFNLDKDGKIKKSKKVINKIKSDLSDVDVPITDANTNIIICFIGVIALLFGIHKIKSIY